MRNFREMLEKKWSHSRFVCVGLDSEMSRIPKHIQDKHGVSMNRSPDLTIPSFNRQIVEATHDLVCAYKPNSAFYEAHGTNGWIALEQTVRYIHDIAPDVPVILDAKHADIGNTNNSYVEMAFGYLRVDAITVHPYLGAEALQPFLARADKGVFVLCRTSNPGAGEFQDIQIQNQFLYQIVAEHVSQKWNGNSNCGLVVGATYPNEIRDVRRLVGGMPLLIPGVGAQGGDLERTVRAGKDSCRTGMIIKSSRGIIFADDPRGETEKLCNAINDYR
ncbi:MAG: orotidine 5'-phosphate decarboxylase [Candidatus Zambryskibacteria bacterium RIFCSPHIGHO2_01_FULL_44_22b]|uniref:Orotidine-5'-phosphate decarboxylase n=1 Tax=Candidatus Zambryskibacteria bacterium RIFCSPHIGHO2_01_FULL_44_22b TaxID=1802737 RepID=A0A1G2SX78_9BACT|nr:MAG: orotidine 5'-phosphate decarboxylase [Candidatus Zambryskibacteria bacterium RIFCSPHIGHO2_01_FULL_44_22b]